MAGRKVKLTTKKTDRKYQRDRTKALQNHDQGLSNLQKTPPKELVGTSRTAYTKIVQQLNQDGFIKQLDIQIVVNLCRQIQVAHAAYDEIFVGKDGKEPEGIQTPIYKAVQGPDGEVKEHLFMGYKKNPAVTVLDSATAKIKSLSESLGMTPASRAALLDMTKTDDDDVVSIDDVMGRSKAANGW